MFKKIKEKSKEVIRKIEIKILNSKSITKVLAMSTTAVVLSSVPTYAAPSIGQNSSTWLLEQLSWIILIVAVGIAAKAYSKSNTVKMIAAFLVGGVLYVICKNPTKLQSFGSWLFEILGI